MTNKQRVKSVYPFASCIRYEEMYIIGVIVKNDINSFYNGPVMIYMSYMEKTPVLAWKGAVNFLDKDLIKKLEL